MPLLKKPSDCLSPSSPLKARAWSAEHVRQILTGDLDSMEEGSSLGTQTPSHLRLLSFREMTPVSLDYGHSIVHWASVHVITSGWGKDFGLQDKVTYLGKVSTTGMQFLSGCTEKPVIELWKKHTLAREDVFPANALLEIRPFQVWLHHLDLKGEATVHMDTFQVARIAYCTADHNVSPNIFAWVYREINDDLSYQMDCHAIECESKLEAKKLAHAMMEAFKKTFHSMKSDGRIHRNSSSEEMSQELESDDG
ncbi:PREDICTED: PTB-containing, cubilin and LRP1-interacting protein [Gekko japonicus]|uniref:PTB-containing, cubilin and LRP1-interacting protein n=1 Tax=Gekko japonicus TaxID=146911 RepID=A0ABM1JK02_GEKJA|nr:PREDICTED: PTB-containing, cubilin and LRP1-interacting protein [Gekko japonicus]